MTSNSEYDKIEKVLAKISGRELKEFGHDHRNFEPARYDVWAEQNKMLAEIVNHSADMVRNLLIKR